MERRLRRTLEIISALCIVSVILMMVSLAGPNSSYVSGPLLQRADKSVKSQHSNLLNGKITAVKIRNGASLSQETSGSVVMAPFMQLSKPISRVTAPKHSFQWLYHNSVLVYSAHYEHSTSLIKIVGFKHRQNHVTDLGVRCVYPDNTSEPMKFLYNVSVITPRPGLLYNTFVWKCKWKSGQLPPHHIKLADRQGQILANMSVTYHTWADGPDKSRQLLLCVKPIVKNYSDAYQLQEFIEMSRLMGAGKVVLYPQSIHEPVIRPIMDKYQASGFVDVHEWKPPVAMEALHAFGQKSHNQHCLYTYKYRYQWAAFIDLDELLVSNSSLGLYEDMIQTALRSLSYDTWVAGFTVQSQMCIVSIDDDPIYRTDQGRELCKLTSLRKTNCTRPMKPGVWSKPLVNTDGTEVVDIHYIRLAQPGYKIVNLDPDIATVHHYRALSKDSMVLEQSSFNNVIKRNTHTYNHKIKKLLPQLCRQNNPLIGEKLFADKRIF